MTAATERRTLRDRSAEDGGAVVPIELFFDLVYVLAVTQLSHLLLGRPTWTGAGQAGLLFALVWSAWAYTGWVTNWLDPTRLPVRAMLLGVMLVSLVLSAGLPEAFEARGLWVGVAWAVMQVGRSVFVVADLRGEPRLRANYRRITVWSTLSGVLAVVGGLLHGDLRGGLWAAAVVVDLIGAGVGFRVPGLGRSRTADWDIDPRHFAERCSAFVLIALGESLVVTGQSLADLHRVRAAQVAAFGAAFAGAALLWWLYFDRTSEAAAERSAASPDPGRLGRSAYHLLHPVIVAGIVVTAAADQRVLADPGGAARGATGWLTLGGAALYVAGVAAFKAVVWHRVSPALVLGVTVLLLLLLLAPHVPALLLAGLAGLVLLTLCALGRRRPTVRA